MGSYIYIYIYIYIYMFALGKTTEDEFVSFYVSVELLIEVCWKLLNVTRHYSDCDNGTWLDRYNMMSVSYSVSESVWDYSAVSMFDFILA